MNIQYINITETEFLGKRLLYKYMPLEFALATINEKYLWLCNPVDWKDPFEKRFINANYIIGGNETEFPIKGQVFCICMTQTPTSEAHWNNYSNGQIGISLKIKRRRFLEVLEEHTTDYDIYIGKVNYIKTADIKKKLSDIEPLKSIHPFELINRQLLIRLLLLKRIAFRYEDEIRVLAVKKYKTKENGVKLSYTLDPYELIDSIAIDPNAERNTENMLKNIFKKGYGFKKVYKSQLYSMPNDIRIEL